MQKTKVQLLSCKEYIKNLHNLNKPELLTHYNKQGCLMMRCNGQPLTYTHERDEYIRMEEEGTQSNNYFEVAFVPIGMFELRRTFKNGEPYYLHTQKPKLIRAKSCINKA